MHETSERPKVSSGDVDISGERRAVQRPSPHAREATEVATANRGRSRRGIDQCRGPRLTRYGPNKITGEKPPSIQVAAETQLQVR